MQLSRLSFVTAILIANSSYAEDYVRVNYMQYNESDNRVDVVAPSIEINKEIGLDYTLNTSIVYDAVSGATPIYTDTTSGASAFNRGVVSDTSKIKKSNVDFTEARKYLSAGLTKRLKNRDEITTSFSKSYESDYDSNTLSIDYLMWADNSKNRSYNMGISYSSNRILVKECDSNNYICDTVSGASVKETSNSFSTDIGYSQIIDKTSLYKLSIFYSSEDGYLSNPYYNVVRYSNKVVAERRPDKRVSNGLNIKYIKSFNTSLSSHFRYRLYKDDWDINSHTIDINNYYEISKKYILGFGLRYYTQSEANFYNERLDYFKDQIYASSDDRLSSFDATTYKLSFDYIYSKKLSYDMSYNIYSQTTGLDVSYMTMGFKYKF
jgi:hypothetical protein